MTMIATSRMLCLVLAAGLWLQAATAQAESETTRDVTFDDIKFDIEKDGDFHPSMLTKEIIALREKAIRIRGYILPASVFRQTGIKQFVLVRDNMECCFGPGAALYDAIMVEMAPGETASFTTRPVAVEGTFSLKPFKGPDGKYLAIYHVTATAVE